MKRTIIDPKFSVADQPSPDEVAALGQEGVALLVNNRPDGEEPGQPAGDAVRDAAAAAGLGYHAIPVTQAGFDHAMIDAMAAALVGAGGPVLAYCRSGTRSCNLWALAAAKAGRNPALLVAQAAGAGYDLSGLRPTLDALADRP